MERGVTEQVATKSDMNRIRDELVDMLRDGFKGIHSRQDITNGRVNKNENGLADHNARLKNMEREIFHRRRSDRGDDDETRENRPLTRREFRIVYVTLGSAGAAVLFIWKVMPAIVKAFQ